MKIVSATPYPERVEALTQRRGLENPMLHKFKGMAKDSGGGLM